MTRQPQKKTRLRTESLEVRQLLAADLVALGPADESGYVSPAANLTLEFDEQIRPGSGNVTIFNAADDSVIEMIDVNSEQVSIDGMMATVDPSSDLPTDAHVYVQVDSGAFVFETQTVYLEDFEDFELDQFDSAQTSDTETEGFDWTPNLPDGWARDNTDTPDGGAIEYFGFNIFNKESWIAEQGNQDRTTFTKGVGNVLVADPDAYDDSVEIDSNLFNVFATTQEFDLAGLPENSVNFQWSNSFRWNDNQTGVVDVSFDGGANWQNLFTQGQPTGSPQLDSLDAANETVSVEVPNPSEGTAQFRFGLVNGSNDWWWAVDNVAVEVESLDNADTFPGIDDDSVWNFSTAPALETSGSDITLSFARDVQLTTGLGDFTIRNAEDGSVVEVIPAASERTSVSGNVVTLSPTAQLADNAKYFVQIDDFTVYDTTSTESTISLFAEDFESLPVQDSVLVGNPDVNDYVVVMSGVLDVTTAGEYTFGSNSDDGQALYIDLDQDGLDLEIASADEVIFDDTTHGNQDRLSTCGIVEATQNCEGSGDFGFELEVGQYAFEYWYFERGGGSSGEFFYAPGAQEIFDADLFSVVGDGSKGIGVTADGITATMYKSTGTIGSMANARDLVLDGNGLEANFPVSSTIPTADVYNTGGTGRFGGNHPLPGIDAGEPGLDWSPEAPEGWTREVTLPGPTAPEYTGWSFLNKEFWIAQQGNQDRTTFTKGENILAVLDPDAADDFINIDDNLFAGSLTTPEVTLSGAPANGLKLQFDSSFRPYPSMQGLVEVSFDGGNEFTLLKTLDEDTVEGGTSSLLEANDTVELDLANPSDGTALFRWSIVEAGNDWWWAIDNIRVTSPFTGAPLPGSGDAQGLSFGGSGEVVEPTPDGLSFGDLDADDSIGFSDFLILSTNFGAAGTIDQGDISGNGVVDFADFLVVSNNFGKTVDQVLAESGTAGAATDDDVATASLIQF